MFTLKLMMFVSCNPRNIPKIIESLSVDGSSGQQIESSNVDPSSGAVFTEYIYIYIYRLVIQEFLS